MDSKSTDIQNRYTLGGETEILAKRLGWWERKIIAKADDDITFKVEGRYVMRPDLIADHLYGKPDLRWLVLQYANISDITTELVDGEVLRLPSKSRVFGNRY